MASPRFGEVWQCDLDPTRGHEQSGVRPCLVISDDLFNSGGAELLIVLPITSRDKRIEYHVPIDAPEGGLRTRSFVKCEDVRSVSDVRFGRYIGTVTDETLDAVQKVLRRLLRL